MCFPEQWLGALCMTQARGNGPGGARVRQSPSDALLACALRCGGLLRSTHAPRPSLHADFRRHLRVCVHRCQPCWQRGGRWRKRRPDVQLRRHASRKQLQRRKRKLLCRGIVFQLQLLGARVLVSSCVFLIPRGFFILGFRQQQQRRRGRAHQDGVHHPDGEPQLE